MKRFLKQTAFVLVFTMLSTIFQGDFIRVKAEKVTEAQKNVNDIKKESHIINEVVEKREENVKHFKKSDGTFEAIVYKEPVHYMKDGKWEEIDNTLKEDTKDKDTLEIETKGEFIKGKSNSTLDNNKDSSKYYSNKESDLSIKVADNINSKELVSIKKDNYKVSWNINGENTSKAEVKSVNYDEEINKLFSNYSPKEKEDLKKITATKNAQEILYKDIYKGIDLQYILKGKSLKENIILKEKTEAPEFTFNINFKDLVPVKEGNLIKLVDSKSKNVVFVIKTPYMYDANGDGSDKIEMNIEKSNKGYKLKLTPDSGWLSKETRKYPIVVDPVITTEIKDSNLIEDTYVASIDTENKWLNVLNRVGNVPGNVGTAETLIRFRELPVLRAGDVVVNSSLIMLKNNDQSGADSIVEAHKIQTPWSYNGTLWSNKPTYDSEILDVENTLSSDWKSWDITKAVKSWYKNGDNYGLLLKSSNPALGYSSYWSSDLNSENSSAWPALKVVYTNTNGLENYMTYSGQSAGRAGNGYINNYSGNLVFTHFDMGTDGLRMPVSVSHVYNSYNRDKNDDFTGVGWTTTLNQRVTIEVISGTKYYVYKDADNTRHYFYEETAGSGKYKNEEGLELDFKVQSDNSVTITDKSGTVSYFNPAGYLLNITDRNNNKIIIVYDGFRITQAIDGAGRTLTFGYNAQGKLYSITDPANRSNYYYYDNDRLSAISYPDGTVTTFQYGMYNNLVNVINGEGYKLSYNYTALAPYRTSSVTEYGTDGTLGGGLTFDYGNNETSITDSSGRTETYQFNDYGNTVSIIGPDGSAKGYKYVDENSNKTNKLSLESRLQKGVKNYILNHNYDDQSQFWGLVNEGQSTGTLSIDNNVKYSRNASLKISKNNALDKSFAQQVIGLEKGKTYTFSGYIKTEGVTNTKNLGAALQVCVEKAPNQWIDLQSKFVQGTRDWDRESVTFTIPNDYTGRVIVRSAILGESGTGYFDALQLEEGPVANRYNLLENATFSGGYTIPYWALDGTNVGSYVNVDSKDVYKINGVVNQPKQIYQILSINGKKGDGYIASAMAKAKSLTAAYNKNRKFSINVVFQNQTESQSEEIKFNEDSNQWQFTSGSVVAKIDYNKIYVYFNYSNNGNEAFVDYMELYKEEYGQSYQYDSKGNILSVSDIAKNKYNFVYNSNNDLVKASDAKGNLYNYQYDEKRNLIKTVTPSNIVTSTEYDKYGNPINSTTGFLLNSINKNLLINNNGFEAGITSWVKANDGTSSATFAIDNGIKYTGKNSLKITKGNSISRSYAQQVFDLEKGKTYTLSGYIKTDGITSGNNGGAVLLVHYKNKNGIWDETQSKPINGTKDWARTSVTFTIPSDAVDPTFIARTAITLESGTAYFDGLQLEEGTAATTYLDGDENKGDKTIKSSSTYTEDGSYLDTTTDTRGNVVKYNYDKNRGNLTSTTIKVDGKEQTFNNAYDINDRLTSVSKNVNGSVASNGYVYTKNNLTTINHNNFSYNFTYDGFQRSKDVFVGSTKVVSNSYDNKKGLLLTSTYGNGVVAEFIYDGLDRLIEKKIGGKSIAKYTYDATNKLAILEDVQNAVTYRYIYDLSDRLVSVKDSLGNESKSEYDANNLVNKVSNTIGGVTYNTSYEFDKDNRVTKVTLGTGKNIQYTYDGLGRVSAKTIDLGNNIKHNVSVDYLPGANGTTTSLVATYKTGSNEFKYTYDEVGNIKTITNKDGKVNSYYYDELNELIREDNGELNKTIVYTYDLGGNLLSKSEYNFTNTNNLGVATKVDNYSYEDNNWKDKLTKYNGQEITYDAIGNPLTFNGYSYSWERGRTLSTVKGNGLDIAYKYNIDGIRTEKTVNGVTTKYTLSGSKVLMEQTGSEKIFYNYDGDNLASVVINNVEYFYLRNVQEDIIGLIDTEGNEVVKYTYDSWGKLISIDGTLKDSVGIKNPYRYRGYRYDSETKQYYLESRYYNPEIGRFINADAIGTILESTDELIDKNIFAYTGNNPINREDSSGYAWETVIDVLSFAGSVRSFIKRPTWVKAVTVIWDGAAIAVPFIPGSYVGKGAKVLSRGKKATKGAAKAESSTIKILGKGSTGRTTANNLTEQLAMNEVKSNPLERAKELTKLKMNDKRWLESDGWVKMSKNVNGTEIHFVYNKKTGAFDDFKFK